MNLTDLTNLSHVIIHIKDIYYKAAHNNPKFTKDILSKIYKQTGELEDLFISEVLNLDVEQLKYAGSLFEPLSEDIEEEVKKTPEQLKAIKETSNKKYGRKPKLVTEVQTTNVNSDVVEVKTQEEVKTRLLKDVVKTKGSLYDEDPEFAAILAAEKAKVAEKKKGDKK
jgi:hypothetical protein